MEQQSKRKTVRRHTAPAKTAPFLRQESPDPGISGFYPASIPLGLLHFPPPLLIHTHVSPLPLRLWALAPPPRATMAIAWSARPAGYVADGVVDLAGRAHCPPLPGVVGEEQGDIVGVAELHGRRQGRAADAVDRRQLRAVRR